MAVPVLVVDASEQFGTLIQQTLEETGYYQVALATNSAQALKISQTGEIRLAIIDFDLPDISGPELIRKLRAVINDLAIIAIPLRADPNDPELKELAVDGLLSKPFYLPDLPKIVANALDQPPDAPTTLAPSRPDLLEKGAPPPTAPLPSWLENKDQAAQYLTQLFLDTDAIVAILTQGEDLWAYAGEVEQVQVEALKNLAIEQWTGKGARGAVTKFIKLPGTDDDYMLYATAVVRNILLSLIFAPEIPFSNIRRQTERFAKTLAEVDPSEPSTKDEGNNPHETKLVPDSNVIGPHQVIDPTHENQLRALDKTLSPDIDQLPLDEEIEVTFSVDPSKGERTEAISIPGDWVPDRPRPAAHLPFFDETGKKTASHIDEGDVPSQFDGSLPEMGHPVLISAILLPNSPEHQLTGVLADHLHNWVQQACFEWNWPIEELEIQPTHLGLTIKLSPEMAPASAVFQLRQELSAQILEAFPELALELSTGHFWANNYLLTAGSPPSSTRIQTFIQNTRHAQGFISEG